MKTYLYRGFQINVMPSGNAVAHDTQEEDVSYFPGNLQDAENLIDQMRDSENSHPISCWYCGEVGKRTEIEMEHWKHGGKLTFIEYECQKPCCQRQEAYDFDMGKAIAKGEL